MTHRRHLAVLVAAVALLSAACGQSTPSSLPQGPSNSTAPASVPASTSPAPRPSGSPASAAASLYASSYRPEPGRPGGEVVVGDWRAPTNLNPYLSNDPVDGELFGATMRSLLRLTADGHWAPDLAAAPIDGRNVTRDNIGSGFSVRVQLRPGLKWSDGQPLTMDDFKFTRQWVLDPKQTAVNSLDWGHVDRMVVGDSHLTAIYHFADAFTDWLSVIGRNPPLPAHYMAKFPPGGTANAYPIGDAIAQTPVSGPYRYTAASADAIVLERNDDWHAGHSPYLDRITFRSTGQNKDQLEAAVSTGTVAVGLDFTADDLSVLDGMPSDRVRVDIVPTWSYEHLDINTSAAGAGRGHPALADAKLRAAIAGAIDRVAAYQAAYPVTPGSAGRACTNAPSTSYWSLPNADARCPKVDPAAANAALDAAGYRPGSDGIRTDPKSGTPLRLRFCTGSDTGHRMVGQFLADGLRRIGIELDPMYVDTTTVLFGAWADVDAATPCNLAHGTFDLALYSSPLGLDLVSDYYLAYHSSQIPTAANDGEGFNYVRLRSRAMDQALGTLRGAIDPAAALAATQRMQQAYLATNAEVPLYFRPSVVAVSTRLHNVAPNPAGSALRASDLWNVEDWWLDP